MNKFSTYSSSWTRRQMLRFIAGAASSIGLHACTSSVRSSSLPASSLTPMTIALVPWIGNTPLYIAEKKGFFRDAGLNLTIRSFDDGAESFPPFSVGQFQCITPVISEAISLAAQGVDYRIVMVMDTSAGADAILARNSVASIADFRGREIAVPKGGVSHFFLLQVLAEFGLSEADVKIVDLNAEVAARVYAAGDVEIACTYSPFLENANKTQSDGRIVYDSSKMPTAIADLYAFDTQFITTNPQAVEAFVSSIFRGLDFLKSNPDEALAIAASFLELQPKELAAQLEGISLPDVRSNVEMLSNPQSDLYLLRSITTLAEFLQDHDQIEAIPDFSEVLDPQFVIRLA
jgi:NitT/TauT family transport system substrate-binding protein